MKKYKVTVNGIAYNVEVQEEGLAITAAPPAPAASVKPSPVVIPAMPAAPATAVVEVAAGETPVSAPMPGKITKVLIKEGEQVKKGDVIMLLEAMKMQNEISAPVDGKIKLLNVTAGQSVKTADVMAVIG